MKKRILSLVLSLSIVLSFLPVISVSAERTGGTCGSGSSATWVFDTSTGTLTINGTGRMPDYSSSGYVPWKSYSAAIKNIVVTSGITTIGENAFSYCENLQNVTLPDTLTQINTFAFENCTNLKEITIPDSVTYIGAGSFNKCISLTEITIPDSVTTINDRAFYDCTGLLNLTIGENVSTVHDYAFAGCSSLERIEWNAKNLTYDYSSSYVSTFGNIFSGSGNSGMEIIFGDNVETIPNYAFFPNSVITPKIKSILFGDNIRNIGAYAFAGGTDITELVIPDSVTSIGNCAFSKFNSLEKITLPFYSNTSLKSIFEYGLPSSLKSVVISPITQTIPDKAFYGCENLTNIEIPDSVTSIGNYAFNGCTGLTSITLSDGVTSIGTNAFNGCTGLTSITIPDSVTSIGENAFVYCSNLTDITLSDSITAIENNTFAYCTSLTSITIPNSVTSIGENVFYNCCNLKEMSLPFVGASRTAGGAPDGVFGYLFGNSTTGEYVVANQYYSVLNFVEYNIPTSLKKVYITDATQIPYGSFEGCLGIDYVSLNEGVTQISQYAFANCDFLSVYMPKSITRIGSNVFERTDVEKLYVSIDSYCHSYAEKNDYQYELYDYYPVTGVAVNETEIDVVEGNTYKLEALIKPENATYPSVTWTSSDTNTAIVSQDGTVTAQSRGTATITVTTTEGGFTSTCKVNVLRAVTSVELNYDKLNIGLGHSKTLTATVNPLGASDKSVSWTSSDTSVATVTNGIVTVVGYGTATITVTTTDGGYTDTCVINSTVPVNSVVLNKTSASLYVGDTLILTPTISPSDAYDKSVTWESSDESVATVVDGNVSAISAGETTITVTTVDGGYSAQCTIKVNALLPDEEVDENAPQVRLSSVKTSADNTVTVDVSIANNPGFISLGLQIDYDSDYLTLTGITSESGVGANFTKAQSFSKIPYNFSWNSTDNIYYDGKLATLTFTVKENAPDGIYPVTLSYYKGISGNYTDGYDVNYDENFNSLGLSYVNGNIAVVSYTPGDINGDGSISDRDATYLLRYLAGWELSDVVTVAIDTDGSGTVNDRDATILLRYLAGWDVTLY